MANPNEWSQFYNTNQTFFTTSSTVSTAVTTTTTGGDTTSIDSRLSPETGRVTKPARRRSRASRRTPTTLLNTDTSNFRAMVQQYTGGPSAMAFGSGNTTSGFSLTSSSDPSAGSSQQVPWQYNFQSHAPLQQQPQRPYMFSLNNVNPMVGYSNTNNPNTVVSGMFGTVDGSGGGGSVPSSKEATNSNTSSSRLQ
ncbi:PREDICTED: VQ motif-containing protein 22-like [Camelina sativa]|uniref:VQ motif-containing protein 22-like n=1 Tax=Camelina sativa TaxID=90675 RepID=A0ABM0W6R4_CAMSA|nr:PREDICTED: VQ motif-containing protein 22-like [Camelina sativa]